MTTRKDFLQLVSAATTAAALSRKTNIVWIRGMLFLPLFALLAQSDPAEHFEKKIRPVLASQCYPCHSSRSKSPMGGLVLDTKAGTARALPKLLSALRYQDPRLQMPPTGKLPDAVINDFSAWIAAGAKDPRQDPNTNTTAGSDLEKGRRWWAFQPLKRTNKSIDQFIDEKLHTAGLTRSPPTDPRTLLRRATLSLTGLAPTYQETEAFAAAPAYAQLIDQLLASPHYGERWARHWLDVARFGEDNPTTEATNPGYPHAWRYRDWVIEALNKDVPYNRFVQLQLAADLMPATPRGDWRALGYLGAAPNYHKDARLSKEVIETLAADDWDERVDAVTRGVLGLTVACARCHDHKFDPILTRDYYSLASVFASTTAVDRPLFPVDAATESRFLWLQKRLFQLNYLARLIEGEPGEKPEEAKGKVVKFRAEIAELRQELDTIGEKYPQLKAHLARFDGFGKVTNRPQADPQAPFMNAVFDAGLWIDGSDPDLTYMDYRVATPRDLPIFQRGSVASPGAPAPRAFLSVLAKSDPIFKEGSGRRELAERLFTESAPLAARVIVNRVWGWHFGKPLVATPSDFGSQGDLPTHPELLDELAARFIEHNWSLKWLHREILLSQTYQQASRRRNDGESADPTNKLLWRMNPRRLDLEAWRDSLLKATAELDTQLYGPAAEVDASLRRTVYAKVSRAQLNNILKLYDVADPNQHAPSRELTTTPLQQLFVMNSPFMQQRAAALVKHVARPDAPELVGALYRCVLSRDPSAKELDWALTFLKQASDVQLAQALLSTNEVIFWP
jgi:cytochrome c553